MSNILLVEAAAPETPSTNQAVIYVKADGKFYTKDDAGTESLVSHANPVTVVEGGTGVTNISSYAIVCGGTTSSAPFQFVSTGTSTQILQSNGAAQLPSWSDAGIAATQAQMEAAVSTSIYVSPGRQHFHPGSAKAWLQFNATGAIGASYNITSVTDTAVGRWIVNIGTDFSSALYAGVIAGGGNTSSSLIYNFVAADASTFSIEARSVGDTLTDPNTPNDMRAVFFGDHA